MEQKFDPTKPVRLRDGREVVIYCTDAPSEYPIHGRIASSIYPVCWFADGRFSPPGGDPSDLINVPEPEVVVYLNIDADGMSDTADTRPEADENASYDRIACVRVTYRPGQFDE